MLHAFKLSRKFNKVWEIIIYKIILTKQQWCSSWGLKPNLSGQKYLYINLDSLHLCFPMGRQAEWSPHPHNCPCPISDKLVIPKDLTGSCWPPAKLSACSTSFLVFRSPLGEFNSHSAKPRHGHVTRKFNTQLIKFCFSSECWVMQAGMNLRRPLVQTPAQSRITHEVWRGCSAT